MNEVPPPASEGRAFRDRMQDLSGMVLDERYVIGPLLGSGAMGFVYEGTHRTLRRKVAIKLLKGEHTDNPTFRRRFEREARSASKIHHPNVVEILDFGEVPDGPLYIIMEFLAGEDLREVLAREGALEPMRTRELLMQIVSAIAAAHEAGVIHRDIKPANIFLSHKSDGRQITKVLDFGVARLEDEQGASALTGASELIGSVAYIAPEMVTGTPANVATDIYALGVMAHEMLCGRHPFPGDDIFTVMNQHLRAAPPPLPPGTPSDLLELVDRALRKDPATRFRSAAEMCELLRQGPQRPHEPAQVQAPAAVAPPPAAPRIDAQAAPLAPGRVPAPTSKKPPSTVALIAALAFGLASMAGLLWAARWLVTHLTP